MESMESVESVESVEIMEHENGAWSMEHEKRRMAHGV
jgi:hypothetical protein